MWNVPGVIVAFYLGAELMIPEKKKIIVIIYGILEMIFEIFLWSMPNAVFNVLKPKQQGDLIYTSFNQLNPAFWLIAFFLASILIFLVIGFAIKAN